MQFVLHSTWRLAGILALSLLSTLSCPAGDATDQIIIDSEPGWVLNRPSSSTTNAPTKAGEILLLNDQQVNAGTTQAYTRIVRRILTPHGVQHGSQLTFEFDPDYERLHLHRIEIKRQGKSLNRLQREKLRVVRREQDLSRHLYHGHVSVLLILDDVRVGDELDYAYTIAGQNPVFGGKFCDTTLLGWTRPAGKFRFRLLYPAHRPLQIDYENLANQPMITERQRIKEYIWERADVQPIEWEPGMPQEFISPPRLWLSEFTNWQEVALWAAPIYATPSKISSELEAQIHAWRDSSPNPTNRLQAALKFVQDEVRYFGIEVGVQSHQPTDPSIVFARRYGDCKDKSVLLCTILEKLGFEARPALVNSYGHITKRLANPLAFNHVIVYCKQGQREYWLDATLSNQRGALDNTVVAEYGDALVIHPATTALTPLPQDEGSFRRTTHETFSLNGTNQLGELTVVTILEGRDAELYRSATAELGDDLLSKSALGSYALHYPLIRTNGAPEVKDEEDRILITSRYHLPEPWNKREPLFWTFDVVAQDLAHLLDEPVTANRRTPLAIRHPCRRIHRTVVNLPDQMHFGDETKVIRGPAEELSYKRISSGRTVTIEIDYRTLADAVPVKSVNEHAKARAEMLDHLGMTIRWRPPIARTASTIKVPRGPLAVLALAFPIGMYIFWTIVQRRPPEPISFD